MTRVAVFGGASIKRRLRAAARGDLEYEFLAPPAPRARLALDPRGFAGALLEIDGTTKASAVKALRRGLPAKPIGGVAVAPDTTLLRRLPRLGLDFTLEVWRPGDPTAAAVLAHLKGTRRGGARRAETTGDTLKATEKRLAILTDVVKTANSILEPGKVIELVMEKIRQLIPSEAWSLLMVDEDKGELVFEAALGDKGSDVASYRLKIGEGVAGWVADTGKPAIVNDTRKDPRFTARLDSRTSFATRSILCAPLVSRGRTIGVLEIINKRDGRFSRPISI